MCLLVAIPENASIDYGRACEAAYNNPDGFGWAVVAGSHIVRFRSMSFDETWTEWELARERWNGAAMWHWRFATGGTIDVHNAHPFEVGGDSRLLLAHNGVLPIAATEERSDTRIMAEDVLAGEDVTLWDEPEWQETMGKEIGANKLVFLSVHPQQAATLYIINENQGHWDQGAWWSNRSYVTTPRFRFSPSPLKTKTSVLEDCVEDCIEIYCSSCRAVVAWDGVDDDCPYCESCLICGSVCMCGGGSPAQQSHLWDDAEV